MAQRYLFQNTLTHRLREMIGQVYIAHNERGVIFQSGRFSRLLSPGYQKPARLAGEVLAGIIPVRTRTAHVSFAAHSCDGYALKGLIAVRYTFDPGQAFPDRQAQAACLGLDPGCGRLLATAVEQSVKKCTGYYLRRLEAARLLSGDMQAQLQQRIGRYVRDVLSPDGIVINAEQGVVIDSFEAPWAVQRMQAQNAMRQPALVATADLPADVGQNRAPLRPQPQPAARREPAWPSV